MTDSTRGLVFSQLGHSENPCDACGQTDPPPEELCPGKQVLSLWEQRLLRKVGTTHEQAETLIFRNTDARRLLLHGWGGTVKIGCPHCFEHYPCEDCVYPEPAPEPSKGDTQQHVPADPMKGRPYQCCRYFFGGVCHGDVKERLSAFGHSSPFGVILLHDRLILHPDWRRAPEKMEKLDIWLRGHIEWGWCVLTGWKDLKDDETKGENP